MTDGSRGLLPPDPSFVPDEQEKDGVLGQTIFCVVMILFGSACAIFGGL